MAVLTPGPGPYRVSPSDQDPYTTPVDSTPVDCGPLLRSFRVWLRLNAIVTCTTDTRHVLLQLNGSRP